MRKTTDPVSALPRSILVITSREALTPDQRDALIKDVREQLGADCPPLLVLSGDLSSCSAHFDR